MPKKLCLKPTHKFYPSPRWSYQLLESKMPVSFDSYSYCGYDCLYCLAYFQKALKNLVGGYTVKEFFRDVEPIPANMKKLERIFSGDAKSQFTQYLRDGHIFQWGGLADPFCPFEKKYGEGLKAMRILDKYKQPTYFSTKGIWWMDNGEYMDLFKRNPNWQLQMSIVTMDDKVARRLEKGCPSPSDRFKAMKKFYDYTGRPVTLRMRPFIIGITDDDDQYIDMIHKAHEMKSHRVSVEWFCLESRMAPGTRARFDKISGLVGFDIFEFYKRNSSASSGYLRLNSNLKLGYAKRISKVCEKLGMAIYYSDSMLKDCSRNNGAPSDFTDEAYFKGNFSWALQLAAKRSTFDKNGLQMEKGKVYFKDIEQYMAIWKTFLWRFAENYNTKGTLYRSRRWRQTMFEWIQERWNLPNDQNSPYHHFHGQLFPIGLDKEENVIYEYVQRFQL